MKSRQIHILGTRGIPAKYGGFETFAEYLALYLKDKGWDVTVYCEEQAVDVFDQKIYTEDWQGIHLVIVPVKSRGYITSIIYDFKAIWHAKRRKGICLVLGYNTAIFNILNRIFSPGHAIIMNMDGIEWKRAKWPWYVKIWFYINELLGSRIAHHMVADHPDIQKHLERHSKSDKITMIPYGGASVNENNTDEKHLKNYDIKADQYGLVIARLVPENNILDIVQSWSESAPKDMPLVVLGNLSKDINYHKKLRSFEGQDVRFLGAIYDQEIVRTLRYYCRTYIHGHSVGGTNPSLVEGIAAGNPIIAHDNPFNRWVAKEGAVYFGDKEELAEHLKGFLQDEEELAAARAVSMRNHVEHFRWDDVLQQYEALLLKFI